MLLEKLLWKNRSRWQVIGASVGVFIGLFLLLLAVQFYVDLNIVLGGAKDSNILILNKDVKTHLGDKQNFSQADIQEVKQQPFFDDVGAFESNAFAVQMNISDLGLRTDIFCQAVPNRFLDIDTTQFYWNPNDDLVPIVLSSDYLALYNYGFAPSQGFPTFTKESIRMLDIKLRVTGRNQTQYYDAYVHDLTRNINSVLVPQSFLEHANQKYGDANQATTASAQLITTTSNPYSQSLNQFLDEKDYEISRGGLIGAELQNTLSIIILLVVIIGVIIVGLSLLVFILNFQLLITQAQQDIQRLIQIGYKYQTVSQFLAKRLLRLLAMIIVVVLVCIFPIKYFMGTSLIEQGYERISPMVSMTVLLTAILLGGFLMWINWWSIQRSVRKLA